MDKQLEERKPRVTRMECPRADWKRVLNAARRTRGLKPLDKEPSENFKRKILLAEHSPIRLLEYDFTIEDIRQWVTVHLVRHHEGCEKFVSTQREDINEQIGIITERIMGLLRDAGLGRDDWGARDYMFQGAENNMDMTCNAQAFINISRKRLCYGCASKKTREAWQLVIEMLREVDPILAEKCVPECIYRNFCPEFDRCCGYCKSDEYKRRLVRYQSIYDEVWKPIEGYEGYEVSSMGRVKRLAHRDAIGRYKEEYLVPICNNKQRRNYEYVHLGNDNCALHRIVAKAFIPNPNNKPEVNHINGNKYDNSVHNLEWVTSQENKDHAWSTGLCNAKHRMVAIRCNETGEIFESVVKASTILNIDRSAIFRNLNGEKKKVKGLSFIRLKEEHENNE